MWATVRLGLAAGLGRHPCARPQAAARTALLARHLPRDGAEPDLALQFIVTLYERLPDDLCLTPLAPRRRLHLLRLEAEVDEFWSFVRRRADKQWLWPAFDKESRRVPAFFVGDRSRESARQLWRRIPAAYPERATFYSDHWEAYKGVIPDERHVVCGKESGLTSGVERFNSTLRQRVSRLVRKALSFSKKPAHHVGAIKYFICHYNQEVAHLS